MNAVRLTDTQLATGLARVAPMAAPAGLRDRILADAAVTPQVRRVPGPLGRLVDAEPNARRKMMVLVAAALVAMGLATGAVVGALLEQQRETIPNLNLAPPADLPAFVRSAYEKMPELEPVTITFTDGTRTGRIYVDGSGAIRTEWYTSPDATEPESYTILNGTRKGELAVLDGRQVWSEQDQAIMEDPRVFVFAALGAGTSGAEPGCEAATSPGETYTAEPGRGWRYVGLDYVAGRPAHHVRCGGRELWIDVDTSLTLRSRGLALDETFQPIPGRFRTVEVTEVVFGQPSHELFELEPPPDVAVVGPDELNCAQDPYCSASPRPVPTLQPAPADVGPPDALDSLLGAALAASEDPPAYEVVVEHWNSKYPGRTTRVAHDGDGRYRIETSFDGAVGPPSILLIGPDHHFTLDTTTDGFPIWRDTSSQSRYRPDEHYPFDVPRECAAGWQILGVDVLGERIVDHIACPGPLAPDEYWIDRETRFVLRHQAMYEEQYGTEVDEVVELRFGPSPPELFELPPGADVGE